jgi:hypothetical protein
MFWGGIVKGDTKFAIEPSVMISIQNVALDTETAKGASAKLYFVNEESQKFLLATLEKGKTDQHSLELIFEGGQELHFSSTGGDIHVTGYLTPMGGEESDEDDMDDFDDDDDLMGGAKITEMGSDEDEDEDEDDAQPQPSKKRALAAIEAPPKKGKEAAKPAAAAAPAAGKAQQKPAPAAEKKGEEKKGGEKGGQAEFKCDKCPKVMNSAAGLQQHMVAKHKAEAPADLNKEPGTGAKGQKGKNK